MTYARLLEDNEEMVEEGDVPLKRSPTHSMHSNNSQPIFDSALVINKYFSHGHGDGYSVTPWRWFILFYLAISTYFAGYVTI